MKLYLTALCFLLVFARCSTPKSPVDQIVVASKIFICNDEYETAEAMAIDDGKVVAYGTKDEITSRYSSEDMVKTEGFVYPGFIDAHSHFYGYGLTLNKVDLQNTFSLKEVILKTVEFAKISPDEWVTGRGWDQTDWVEKGNISNNLLNAYFPDRPVFIKRIDGHAGIANQKALDLAGITTETKISGGEIEIMGNYLTGLLTDNAMTLIDNIIPSPSRENEIKALLKAQNRCYAVGLTTVTDAGLDLNTILLIDSLQKTGDLTIRIYAMCNPTQENFEYFEKNGPILTKKLSVNSFKLYADGALGSRGAKLKKAYCDHPNYTGVWVTEPTDLDSFYKRVYNLNFQANTHCIGDSANKKVLELYGELLKGKNDKRWRIEHAQIVTPADRKLFARYSVIPSVQPTHATSDMKWVDDRLCTERLEGAYSYKSLLALNGYLPLGTDFPVENISPLKTFFAAVYRQDSKKRPLGGFIPEESLSPKEALLGITNWAAKGNFMESKIGSLTKGKLADYVILDKNITIDKYMLTAAILGTYQEGKKVN
ncbi:MAG: amidohydrolase [Bacteroidetes bacterium]|nr:MAG: amidohydrolase [Bacteroidota bacterium]